MKKRRKESKEEREEKKERKGKDSTVEAASVGLSMWRHILGRLPGDSSNCALALKIMHERYFYSIHRISPL